MDMDGFEGGARVTVGGGAFDGVDGQFAMFPTEFPWTDEAGFIAESPPAQIGDALTRAMEKTRHPADPHEL